VKKLNILHISPDFNYSCGVSKYVFQLLEELSKRDELHLFFLTNKGDSINRLSGLNVKIDFLNFERENKNPFKFVLNYFFLLKFCMKNKIEIIHTHHRYPELLAYFVSMSLKIKTITTVHSLVDGWKFISFKSDKIIAVSNAVKKHLIQNYRVNSEKVFQLYNFVKSSNNISQGERRILKQKIGIENNNKVLLFIGRICYIKGCDILISAFEKLLVENPLLKLIMIGNFESFKIKDIVQKNNKIIYISPTNEILSYYYLSDIVILPSRIDSFPFVMLEAGLAKKTFIGGKTGGIAEFIDDGVDGLLVEPGSVNDLEEKIQTLMDNQALSNSLANKLHSKVMKFTNSGYYISKLIEIYES